MNVVVLRGRLPRDPEHRDLATGGHVVQFDLSTQLEDGTVTVPVSWFDPPASANLAADAEVVLVGSVRRRFFRAGGTTQSRTEVVAHSVTSAGRRAAVAKLLDAAVEQITGC